MREQPIRETVRQDAGMAADKIRRRTKETDESA